MALDFPQNCAWPPAPYDRMVDDMQVWTAWWKGNTDDLTDIYSDYGRYQRSKYRTQSTPLNSEEDDIFFWGRPADSGVRRRHVTAPASVARAAAGLLFAKPPRIEPGPKDEKNAQLRSRMEKLFGPRAYGGKLGVAAELASVLGGVYLRPWWDKEIADHVVPSHVTADCAIPEFRFDRLIAVTFWNVVSDQGENPVLRHLERHEKGKIIHGLYSGTESNLGERVDLKDHHATAWAAGLGKDGTIDTGVDELDVVYIPNVSPQRAWYGIPTLSQLGRSDFDGIEGEFDALDEIETSLMRDVKDAKSRIIVPEEMLDDNGPGKGGTYDSERHIYTTTKSHGVGSMLDANAPEIRDIKFPIRVQEHSETKANTKQNILEHVGLSSQHFADGPLSVTATAVDSDNNITETTRGTRITTWQDGIARFVNIVMRLDAIHFPGGVAPTDLPTVRFSAQHIQSEEARIQNVATKRSAGLVSREQGIREINPDWTDPEVNEELERIIEDAIFETRLSFGQGFEEEEPLEGEGNEDVENNVDELVDEDMDALAEDEFADEFADEEPEEVDA